LSNAVKVNINKNWYFDGTNPEVSLPELLDGWGRPMKYRFHGQGNFPRFYSAGVDGIFLTADDIVSTDLH
jgi:hypothetical protein